MGSRMSVANLFQHALLIACCMVNSLQDLLSLSGVHWQAIVFMQFSLALEIKTIRIYVSFNIILNTFIYFNTKVKIF